MQPVIVTISHSMQKADVIARLEPVLGKAAETFPLLKVEQERWDGDRLEFRVRALGQAVVGHVHVNDKDVRVEVSLPWLLGKFASALQKTIVDRGQILLEKK